MMNRKKKSAGYTGQNETIKERIELIQKHHQLNEQLVEQANIDWSNRQELYEAIQKDMQLMNNHLNKILNKLDK